MSEITDDSAPAAAKPVLTFKVQERSHGLWFATCETRPYQNLMSSGATREEAIRAIPDWMYAADEARRLLAEAEADEESVADETYSDQAMDQPHHGHESEVVLHEPDASTALAEAWASIDGKLPEFLAGRGLPIQQQPGGHYDGYIAEAVEMISRLGRRGFVVVPEPKG